LLHFAPIKRMSRVTHYPYCARISRVKGNAFGLKPFKEPSREEATCPVKFGQQPEASLAY